MLNVLTLKIQVYQLAQRYVSAAVGYQAAPVPEVQGDLLQPVMVDPAPVYLGLGWMDSMGWVARYQVEVPGEVLLPLVV